ncbi:MAG: hypothetical protein H7267_06350 [Sandarakinorhabdus sp.]|nr:hypothetical protein [Sandarakinorhabdus sp.]
MGGTFLGVQRALGTAVGNWNKLVVQVDRRVRVRARRFKEMGAATRIDDLVALAPVVQVPMLPSSGELAVVMVPGIGEAAG